MSNKIWSLMKDRDVSLKDIYFFIQGHLRYRIFYSSFRWIMRKHIREQIEYRIEVMNPLCYARGSCIVCGCATTQLQMCNKPCDGNCYPPIMNKTEWSRFKIRGIYSNSEGMWMKILTLNGMHLEQTEQIKFVKI